jgi:ELWxxDGT repeat protein
MKTFVFALLLLWINSSIFGQITMLKNINQSTIVGLKYFHGVVDNKLIFTAESTDTITRVTSQRLWVSDGTELGTVSLNYPGLSDDLPVFSADSVLFFAYRKTTIIGSSSSENYVLLKINPTSKVVSVLKNFDTETIYTTNGDLQSFAKSNGAYYFSAFSQSEGIELWKTNATTQGTVLVKDIETGNNGSFPTNFVDFNNTLYFCTWLSNTRSSALWKSDGSANGTIKIKDFGSVINKIVVSGNKLFLFTQTGLWVSDGTEAGTILLSNNMPDYNNCIDVNGVLFFSFQSDNGKKLWKSDGVSVVLVKDFVPITNIGYISKMTNFNGILVFRGGTIQSPYYSQATTELWRSDGTDAGTYIIKKINDGFGQSDPDFLTVVGNTLYFSAWKVSTGFELYKTDGTLQGTVLVKNISVNNDYPSENYNQWMSTAVWKVVKLNNNTVAFYGNTQRYGVELWKSDGTEAGTNIVKDINLLEGQNYGFYSFDQPLIYPLVKTNNKIYFTADDGPHGRELWESDGTSSGTKLFSDFIVGTNTPFRIISPSELINNNELITIMNSTSINSSGSYVGNELHKINLDTKQLSLVKDIKNQGSISAKFMQKANNIIFFNPQLGLKGSDLWRTDGTDAGTFRIRDFSMYDSYAEQSGQTNIDFPTEFNGQLYFYAKEETNGSYAKNLWKSDGSIQGTVKVKEFATTYGSGGFRSLKVFKNKLFMIVQTPNLGAELWVSDGTTAGTENFIDIQIGAASADPYILDNNNDFLYFLANDVQGYALWKTDGTLQGTSKIKNLPNLNGYYGFSSIDGDILYFVINTVAGNTLYRSDGTASGTYTLNLPSSNLEVGSVLAFRNSCLFIVSSPQGIQIWRTNGTLEGTYRISKNSDFLNSTYNTSSFYNAFFRLGNKVLIKIRDAFYGEEFWNYDTCEYHETITSGNWNISNTWSCGQIPTVVDETTINKGHTILLDSEVSIKNMKIWGSLIYSPNGKLNLKTP